MSNRITVKQLKEAVDELNELFGLPVGDYTNGKANVGSFTLSGAYGGWQLQQFTREGGGCLEVFSGYVTPGRLFEKIRDFRRGVCFERNRA